MSRFAWYQGCNGHFEEFSGQVVYLLYMILIFEAGQRCANIDLILVKFPTRFMIFWDKAFNKLCEQISIWYLLTRGIIYMVAKQEVNILWPKKSGSLICYVCHWNGSSYSPYHTDYVMPKEITLRSLYMTDQFCFGAS